MITFILRRLAASVLLVLIVTLVTFVIFFLVPKLGGQTSDQLAAQYVGRNPSPAAIAATKRQLGLDQSLPVQYGEFVKGFVVGRDYNSGPQRSHCPAPCLGYSFKNQQPVLPLLLQRLPVTLSLAAGAAVLWLVGGVAVGVISGLRPRSLIDRTAMTVALAGVSAPIFFTGLLSLAFFSYRWPIFPNVTYVPLTSNPVAWFTNLVLPWVTLAFLYAAIYARLTRAGMLETLGEDYIRTARAKGLKESIVIRRHALRAVLTPILTVFGLDLGLLVGGAVLTETTFSLPGVGAFAITAIQNNDLPEIMGVTLIASVFVIAANLIVDVLYAVIDPRVRYS